MKQPNTANRRPSSPARADNISRSDAVPVTSSVPLLGVVWTWWLDHTSNVRYDARSFDERIRSRRSRVGSGIFLGLIVLSLMLAIVERLTTSDLPTFFALLAAIVGLLLGCLLNRFNQVEVAGALVALVIDAAIFGAVLSAPNGMLDTDYLGSYYLMALILGVVAILMPPWGLLVATTANCALIGIDFLVLQRYTPALTQQLAADGYFFEIGRPIVLNIGIAFALYILVRTLLGEGRRADRAEEVALLEERELERQRSLEEGVRELLAVHVQLANGNFNARVPQISNQLLWQIGASLNNLMNRLARLGQADFAYQRTQQENMRLAEALRMLAEGRTPVWPARTGTSTDAVSASIQALLARLAAGDPVLLKQLTQGAAPSGGSMRIAQPGQPSGPQTGELIPGGGPMSPMPRGFSGPSMPQTGGIRPPWRAPQLQAPQTPQEGIPFSPASPGGLEEQLPAWFRHPVGSADAWSSEQPDPTPYLRQDAFGSGREDGNDGGDPPFPPPLPPQPRR